MSSKDLIKSLEYLISRAKFADWVSNQFTWIRFSYESNEKTLERLIEQAKKTICDECRGTRRNLIDRKCSACNGTGEKMYDPNEKVAKEVIER